MANDADYRWALSFTLKWEGGDHHPTLADPNPTSRGVTQRFYDAVARKYGWRAASVFDLMDNEIESCYRLIWEQSKASLMPRLVACAHFDCSVNMSGPRANRVLQRALGVTADGVLGPRSFAAIAKGKPLDIAGREVRWRECEHLDLVEANARLKANLAGWLNRTKAMKEHLGVA